MIIKLIDSGINIVKSYDKPETSSHWINKFCDRQTDNMIDVKANSHIYIFVFAIVITGEITNMERQSYNFCWWLSFWFDIAVFNKFCTLINRFSQGLLFILYFTKFFKRLLLIYFLRLHKFIKSSFLYMNVYCVNRSYYVLKKSLITFLFTVINNI